jgi:hypothetical protein
VRSGEREEGEVGGEGEGDGDQEAAECGPELFSRV